MIRAIYLDIDGTLRDEIRGISQRTKAALKHCQMTGIQIAVCTGRSPACVQDDVLALNLDGVISGGGCYIYYQGKTIFSKHFPKETVQQFLTFAKENPIGISIETAQKLYMNSMMADFYHADAHKKYAGYSDLEIRELLRSNKLAYNDTLALYQYGTDFIHKVCVIGPKTSIDTLRDYMKGRVQIVQNQPWAEKWYLECLPVGCSKGTAIKQLNHLLHIPQESSIGFGDGGNDIDLLRATGVRVAVAGGSPQLLRWADSVCEPPAQDGVCKELFRRKILSPEFERSVSYGYG
ncbi:MAG: HAD family hydrolase [Oscillospiraceae bacterium]|nr:HAD family hydrolase [Oscillospiraceae bacterium]